MDIKSKYFCLLSYENIDDCVNWIRENVENPQWDTYVFKSGIRNIIGVTLNAQDAVIFKLRFRV